MDNRLRELLVDNPSILQAEGNTAVTHVTHFGPRANWLVDDAALPRLWEEYCRAVHDVMSNEKETSSLCLAEQLGAYMPLILHFNFRAETMIESFENENQLPDLFVERIIAAIQLAIRQVFIVGSDGTELYAIRVEACRPNFTDNVWIYSLRLYFPYCVNTPKTFATLLRSAAIQVLRESDALEALAETLVEDDWAEILSDSTFTQPVTMYGSVDRLGVPLMYYTGSYGEFIDESADSISLAEMFVPANHSSVTSSSSFNFLREVPEQLVTGVSDEADLEASANYFLPVCLSIGYCRSSITRVNEHAARHKVKITPKTTVTKRDALTFDVQAIAVELLSIVDLKRFTNKVDWIRIGRSLFRIFKEKSIGLETWRNFTPTIDDKINPDACEDLWVTFDTPDNHFTIRTIGMMAKTDNPEKYKKWHFSFWFPSLEEAIKRPKSDIEISRAIYRYYWLDFVCADNKENRWFQFKGHYWKPCDNAVDFRMEITDSFRRKLFTVMSDTADKAANRSNSDTSSTMGASEELQLKNLEQLRKRFESVTIVNKIIQACRDPFYEEGFISKLDVNPHVIGVANGVIEVTRDEFRFREGTPDDYISKLTPTNFNKYYHWGHPIIKKILKWFRQLFPMESMQKAFRMQLAASIRGRNVLKRANVWWGPKCNNGKSTFKKLMEYTWGDYVATMPTTFLTAGKKKSNEHSTEAVKLKWARFIFFQEFDDDEKIRKGTFKEMTGTDKMGNVREIHQKSEDIYCMGTIYMLVNEIPEILNAQEAEYYRLHVLPWLSRWVDDARNLSEEDQMARRTFKMDPEFEDKLSQMASGMLWVMCQDYNMFCDHYKVHGSDIDTPEMKKAAAEYWESKDHYVRFRSQFMDRLLTDKGEIDESTGVPCMEAWPQFRTWFRNTVSSSKVPDQTIFAKNMQRIMGEPRRGIWPGYRWIDGVGGSGL